MTLPFKYHCLLFISPTICLLDQVTKALVRAYIPRGDAIPLLPGYVDLVHTMNTGAAFGLFAGTAGGWRTPFFLTISGIALGGIGYFCRRLPRQERLLPVMFSLVTGGILGNLIDRLRFGAVVDFFSVHWRDVVCDTAIGSWRVHVPLEWPAFNVADSAITISMVLLCYQMLRQR